jgi:5,10-methylenetetrahydrofolate reductase
MSHSNLRAKLLAPAGFVSLYGTTPPRANASPERIAKATERLAARIAQLPVDGLVVYDVQDEAERTAEPRPFPFLPTLDSRTYARRLQQHTGHAAVVYKCVAEMPRRRWRDWLDESKEDYSIELLSLVGRASSTKTGQGVSLSQATRLAAQHSAGYTLGGVVIAERHMNGVSEADRILRKTESGCRFFISQAVYHAETTVRLLQDYVQTCAEAEQTPQRIIFTFAPCGREKTMHFMRWLGIKIEPETADSILNDPAPLSRSIAICCDNLRRILDRPAIRDLPLGINVESVSIHKDEIDASVDLFHALQEVVQSEYQRT